MVGQEGRGRVKTPMWKPGTRAPSYNSGPVQSPAWGSGSLWYWAIEHKTSTLLSNAKLSSGESGSFGVPGMMPWLMWACPQKSSLESWTSEPAARTRWTVSTASPTYSMPESATSSRAFVLQKVASLYVCLMTETSSHPGRDRNARGFSLVLESLTWETVTIRTIFSEPATSIGISHIGSPPHRYHRASGAGRREKERRNETAVQTVYSFNFSFKENWLP